MKLYYSPGACSLGPHIVLREVGLPFEIERVDIATKQTETGRDLRDVNPRGTVPVLEVDGAGTFTEGPAIVQFIADRAADPALAPGYGTVERARVQEVLNFNASELRTAFGPLFAPSLPADARAAQAGIVAAKLDWLEGLLAGGRAYLCGADYTLADAHAFAMVGWTRLHGIPMDRWPGLTAWMARIAARPAVQAALAAEGLAA